MSLACDRGADLNLSTYPPYHHDGSEGNVIASTAPTLEEVLQGISQFYLRLSPS